MTTWTTRICMFLLAVTTAAAPAPVQTPATGQVMRSKLAHTQQILGALMTSNFTQLQQECAALARAPAQPGWEVLNTPEYRRHTGAFVNAMQGLVDAANERDLDAAAVHYAAMTMTCYQCHRYIKNARIADGGTAR